MENRLKKLIKLNIILIFIFLLYFFINRFTVFSIPCLFYYITGLKCPGCGITRCLFSIIKMDFKSAFYYNSLVTILLIPGFIYYVYNCYYYILGKRRVINHFELYFLRGLLIVVILFGIFRNF